ncbi:CsbD family protein [Luteirhabdus pelagi]|uniref:CsbD family protein n=1 Tax=Luteirhabdus pelagi TaxID=2792783 RepID=UPI00193A589B|nr:CsbD family protein [Luteirhabdus pelagi]MCT8339977.1 CsbD family protein [Thermobacterium salinum]
MNSDQLKGKWKQIKGKAKQEYGIQTDDNEAFSEGKYDELVGRIQEESGKTKEEVKREIETW